MVLLVVLKFSLLLYYGDLTPQNLSIEICIKKIISICIYVKIALTKKKKKKKF